MPKFSIILPIYNKANCLMTCLKSIQKQSFSDFECILVDDGSTDHSYSLCKKFSEQDNRFIPITKSNGGVSSARNKGIDLAQGEFLTFIDPDDYVSEDYLKNLYVPEFDLVCSRMAWKNENSDELTYIVADYARAFSVSYESIAVLLHDAWIESACAKSFRKSIIDERSLRFPENIPWGEDTLFAVSFASKSTRILVRRACDYIYVGYGESTSLSTQYSREFYSYAKIFSRAIREQIAEDFERDIIRDEFIERILFMYEKTMVFCATVAPELSLSERIKDIQAVLDDEEYRRFKCHSDRLSSYPSYIRLALKTNHAPLIALSAAVTKPVAKLLRKVK